MVVCIKGTVNSKPVCFNRADETNWEAVVPADLENGTYIVEITAFDDAGNQTYHTAQLYIWSKVITSFKILEEPFINTLLCSKYSHILKEEREEVFIQRKR